MADPSVVHAITEKTTPALSAVGVAWRQTVDQGERGGSLVALSGSLVGSRKSKPGLAPQQLSELMNLVIVEGQHLGPEALAENVADLFVLAFELGDVREGRGERQLFVDFVLRLLKFFPETVVGACRLIPEYASWRTVNLLYVGARKALQSGTEDFGEPALLQLLCERLKSMYIEQLEKDRQVLAEHDDGAAAADAGKAATVEEGGVAGISAPARAAKGPSVSLASKWAPTIGCSVDKQSGLGQKLAADMFPVAPRADEEAHKKAVNWQQQQYRRLLSKLRAASDVVERKMCLKRWREIEPSHVPSVANRKYRKALLNESKGGDQRSAEEDRIACAANVRKCIEDSIAGVAGAKTIKGARNQIHEIVVPYMCREGVDPMLEAIYVDIVKKLKESGTFRPAIPLVDVSGSMSGLPMQVAIGLGILLSDLLPEPLKGRVLTFTEKPAWANVTGDTLCDKVRCVARLPWGMNTNFAAALKEILEFCKANEVSPDMVPETLFIFSDMQWDHADHSAAHLARSGAADDPIFSFGGQDIRAEFEAAGFRPPHIVFWNLRATGTPTFQADSCSPGMSLMSGFSQEVLKDYMEDGSLHSGTEVTPWEKLSEKLWKTRYDAVRRVCEELQEGMLKGYTFAPPARKGDEGEEDGRPAAGGGGGGAE